MRCALWLVVVVATLAATGCRFGQASFTGTLVDRGFDPTGTVFGYVDAHDDALVEDPDDDPPVAVAMTWLVFDAASDLSNLDGAALASYAHEVRLRDALSLVFDQRSSVQGGESFSSTRINDDETEDDGFTAYVHLAPEQIDATNTYADFVPYATKRVVHVDLEEVDLTNAKVIAGKLSVAFARGEADEGDVKEGTVTGTFRAPLVDERTAERNLSLLDVEDMLGLPLTAAVEEGP
jgi:hypothetical protein